MISTLSSVEDQDFLHVYYSSTRQICQYVEKEGWTINDENNAVAPYAFKDNQWVSFDSMKSIKIKVRC